MLVGSPVPVAPIVYRVPVPVPVPAPAPAIPTIHPALTRPPFQWDVRATALPTTLTRDQPYCSEPAFKFSPPLASIFITLHFTTPRGAGFTHTIAGALRVVDVLRAIHDAPYTHVDLPRRSRGGTARFSAMGACIELTCTPCRRTAWMERGCTSLGSSGAGGLGGAR